MLSADVPLHNAINPYDVNGDAFVTPTDLLRIVNAVNGEPLPENEPIYLDVNEDSVFTLDDYYAQRALYDDPPEYDAPEAELINLMSTSGPSGPSGASVSTNLASQTVVSGLTAPGGATAPSGSSAPSGATGTSGGAEPTGLSEPIEPAGVTGPSGPSGPDGSTGLVQSPTACDTGGSAPQLSGGSVDEGDELNLGYIPNENPDGHDVVWVYVDAEGMSYTLIAGDEAIITFMDDDPTNTPSDEVEVELTFVLVGDCGQLYEKTQTRTVTVHNVPPTASDDTLRVGNRVAETINVLENDTDPGTDALSVASIDASRTNGTVTHIGGGTFEYIPGDYYSCLGEGETATDSFAYTIHDDDDPDSTSSATVTVTVVGSRHHIRVSYNGGSAAEDDGNGNPSPGSARITLDPAPMCGDVTVNYANATTPSPWDEFLEPDQVASASDIENSSGSVVIPENTSVVDFELIPVDDELIEREEWYFWTVEAENTDNYFFWSEQDDAVTYIEDDEWRFVAESETISKSVGPLRVEAFTRWLPAPFTSTLSGGVDYIADYTTQYNSATDSTAKAEARAYAELTRYFDDNEAWHRMEFRFTCDSQTGDVQKTDRTKDGDNTDGPLALHNNMRYDINDAGDDESRVYVELDTKFLAGGEITSGATFSGSVGYGKGTASGKFGYTSGLTYPGGRESERSGSFNLTCNRGE